MLYAQKLNKVLQKCAGTISVSMVCYESQQCWMRSDGSLQSGQRKKKNMFFHITLKNNMEKKHIFCGHVTIKNKTNQKKLSWQKFLVFISKAQSSVVHRMLQIFDSRCQNSDDKLQNLLELHIITTEGGEAVTAVKAAPSVVQDRQRDIESTS